MTFNCVSIIKKNVTIEVVGNSPLTGVIAQVLEDAIILTNKDNVRTVVCRNHIVAVIPLDTPHDSKGIDTVDVTNDN